MSFDFLTYRQAFAFPHSPINRWGKFPQDVIPLWVADMDYPTAPSIINAMTARIHDGRLGYVAPPASLYTLVAQYCAAHYSWQVQPEWVVFLPGVVPGLAASVLAHTKVGESVLVPKPVYTPFYEVVEMHQRTLSTLPFVVESGRLVVDKTQWQQSATQSAKMLLWCNPHNPGGTVFQPHELAEAANWAIAAPDRVVVSDEIHADIGLTEGYRHVPLASLSAEVAERTITLMSPNKAFNIPSMGMAYAIIPNPTLRESFKQVLSPWQHHTPTAIEAVRVCLNEATSLLPSTIFKIRENVERMEQWAKQEGARVEMIRPEASYLVWMKVNLPVPAQGWVAHFAAHGVGINGGELYRAGAQWLRINVATDAEVMTIALSRMRAALDAAALMA